MWEPQMATSQLSSCRVSRLANRYRFTRAAIENRMTSTALRDNEMIYCPHPVIDAHIERLLGAEVHALLTGAKAQEISVNADGRIFIDDGRASMFLVDGRIEPGAIETAVRMLAAIYGIWLDADAPFLNTVLSCGARFS